MKCSDCGQEKWLTYVLPGNSFINGGKGLRLCPACLMKREQKKVKP